MTQATHTTLGEIRLAGDLAGDGGAQVGTNPQLTHISGLTPGQYDVADITVDSKGRVTSITNASASNISALLPNASTTQKGVVQIGANLYITDNDAAGFWTVDLGIVNGTDATGLVNDTCATYTINVQIDGGVIQPVSFTGSQAQTFDDLINAINADITGAIAVISSGDIVVVSDTLGQSSHVVLSDDGVFNCLNTFVDIGSETVGVGSCELYAKHASATEAGVVQIGSGITVNASGVISVNTQTIPIATDTTLGGVKVQSASAIDVDASGNLTIPDSDSGIKGVLSVTENDGLTINAGVLTLNLPVASTTLGAIQVPVGSALNVDGSGNLDADVATASTLGVVQVGNGLEATAGVLSVPIASTGNAGVVKGGGSGITIAGDGTLNVDTASLNPATTSTLGVVQIGSGISVDGSGIISTSSTVQDATTSQKGIVQIGNNIDVAAGVISIPDADGATKGLVSEGTGVDITSGVLTVDNASGDTTLGVVKSANTANISIVNGEIDLGSGVVTSNSVNTFTKTQSTSITNKTHSNAGGFATIDLATDTNNVHITVNADGKLDITNVLVDTFTNVTVFIKQSGGFVFDLLSADGFIWSGGVAPTFSIVSGETDVVNVCAWKEGVTTKFLCSYVGRYA